MKTKSQQIQDMLDGATSIEIDGIELTGWSMDNVDLTEDCESDEIAFSGYAETEDGDYHWNIPAWGFGEIAEVTDNRIFCKDDLGEECSIECFIKLPYTGK